MAEVSASIEIAAPLAEVWDLYFDKSRWAAWVDGFGSVEASSDDYPERGSTLRWRSTSAGRGKVSERVLEHDPRRSHRSAFADPSAEGELQTRFELVADGGGEGRTRVSQLLTYELAGGGPLSRLTDRLFIRGQMQGSLQRSLGELRLEAEATERS